MPGDLVPDHLQQAIQARSIEERLDALEATSLPRLNCFRVSLASDYSMANSTAWKKPSTFGSAADWDYDPFGMLFADKIYIPNSLGFGGFWHIGWSAQFDGTPTSTV